MDAVEFRTENGVLQFRSLCLYPSVQRNADGDEYDGPLDEGGYTDWTPLTIRKDPLILAVHLDVPVTQETAEAIRNAMEPDIRRMKENGHDVYGFIVAKGMRMSVLGEPPTDDRLTKLAQDWWDHECGVLSEDQSEEATQIACNVLGIGDDDDE